MRLKKIHPGSGFALDQKRGASGAKMTRPSPSRPMFGLQFSCESTGDIAQEICSSPVPEGGGIRLLTTLNVDHVVNLRKNPAFRKAYRGSWKTTIDGMPILI